MLFNSLHQHACRKVWALALLLATPALGAAPTHTDGRWAFENDTLRVSVSDTEPVWDVLDERSNRLWRQAREPEGTQWVVPVRRAVATPTLGGQLREWLGDGVVVSSKTAAASDHGSPDPGAAVCLPLRRARPNRWFGDRARLGRARRGLLRGEHEHGRVLRQPKVHPRDALRIL